MTDTPRLVDLVEALEVARQALAEAVHKRMLAEVALSDAMARTDASQRALPTAGNGSAK